MMKDAAALTTCGAVAAGGGPDGSC